MPADERFVVRLNIEHFKKKLASESDEARRQTLLTLLAEEEVKLAALEGDPPGDRKRG